MIQRSGVSYSNAVGSFEAILLNICLLITVLNTCHFCSNQTCFSINAPKIFFAENSPGFSTVCGQKHSRILNDSGMFDTKELR